VNTDATAKPEPFLAIDFGTSYSSAVMVTSRGQAIPVCDPVTLGPAWPSAVFADGPRLLVGERARERQGRDLDRYREEFKRELGSVASVELGDRRFSLRDLVTAVIKSLKDEAEKVLRESGESGASARLRRTVLTVPASYEPGGPQRALMLAAAEEAGLGPVQLLTEPAAAAYAVMQAPASARPEIVLVYDFGGGTFDAALVRVTPLGEKVLGSAALEDCGGSDLDTRLAIRLRADAGGWVSDTLDARPAGQAKKARGALDADFRALAQRMKHHLSEAGDAKGHVRPGAPISHLTYADLTREAAPLLAQTVRCCRDLLSLDLGDNHLDAILLVGGSTRTPEVGETLRREFPGVQVRRPLHPQLAVVQGAAEWARRYAVRQLDPLPSRGGASVLRWDFPGTAEFQGWRVKRGQWYPAGATLALIRLANGTLWQLTADEAGRLGQLLVSDGDPVTPDQWLATTMRAPHHESLR
jgi:molecular chaperone DnaK